MNQLSWDAIFSAVELVGSNKVNKVEGEGWKVYRVGIIIRIDIEQKLAY